MTRSGRSETDLPFEELISRGGDERLDLGEEGRNKYNVDPACYPRVFNRGSCTCSPFSEDGYLAARKLYERLSDAAFDHTRLEHAERLKQLINYADHDRFHVFFAPSGSDLCYYQLLFSKLINPDLDIFNVITCPEELGSGSIAALQGQYYSSRNQFGQALDAGSALSESLRVDAEMLPARSESGEVINHTQAIADLVHARYRSHSVAANLVIGSKSGIENNIAVVSQVPDKVLWTVDLCQFRASPVLINGLIGMNCSVMLTGSKFYNAPPFCAVLLVPKTLAERFSKATADVVGPFSRLFSRHDVPPEFEDIRAHLPDYRNFGLLLRWEAALAEMSALSRLDPYEVNQRIDEWNRFVVDRLQKGQAFELMPGYEVTNKTIVSFRVRNSEGDYLSHDQLVDLYRSLCTSPVSGLEGGFDRVLFGQPVRYGDRSFIRIALGAGDLRSFVENGFDGGNDGLLIDCIGKYVGARR